MEKRINIAELLKDCPNGMELDSTIYNGVVTLEGVADCLDRCIYPIKIRVKCDDETFTNTHTLTEYGQISPSPCDKCIIFPKGKTTWEGFHRPFKDGDIVVTPFGNMAIISEHIKKGLFHTYVILIDNNLYISDKMTQVYVRRFATEEEKEKLFKAIQDNGYEWDAETKTLEKVIETKEETDEETKATKGQDYSINRCVYQIPDGYEFDCIENNAIILKSKHHVYPKDYEECCGVLGTTYDYPDIRMVSIDEYSIYTDFITLIRCRNAYWKLAGEQMGLEKSWEPDYDSGVNKYGIIYMNKVVQKSNPTTNWERHLNKVLDFPTEEMRDAFYENFKDLIEKCKELL